MDDINLGSISRGQESDLRSAVSGSFGAIKNNAVIKDLAERIDVGDIEGVLIALGITEAAFGPIEQVIQASYRKGGDTGAKQVGRIPDPGGQVSFMFSFNARNPRAEQWLRQVSSDLITEITQDQKEMVRQRLTAGLSQGVNPRQSALDLVGRLNRVTRRREGGFIGMTSRQAEWVSNARAELQELSPNYLTRKLRDKRFDRSVRRAIETGKPLNKGAIDNMVSALQSRTVKYRGDVIARTESINALRAGQHESLRQATEAGDVLEEDVTREWDATGDLVTRPTHAGVDGQKRKGNAPFTVGGYQLRYPGDSSLGAPGEETISCRCHENTSINFGARVARIEGFG